MLICQKMDQITKMSSPRLNLKGGICGVYCISTPNGEYVGSALDIRTRWYQHRHTLRKRTSNSAKLQAAFNKHGDLSFSVLELCEKTELLEVEARHIRNRRPRYNIVLDPRSPVKSANNFAEKIKRMQANGNNRKRRVACSNGVHFASVRDAAETRGISISEMSRKCKHQMEDKSGIRFRFADQAWVACDPYDVAQIRRFQNMSQSRIRNGIVQSPETRRKKSLALAGKPWSEKRMEAHIKGKQKAEKQSSSNAPWGGISQ